MFRKFAVFHRKDNIKGVQELSTANLFNIKKANFLPCDRDRSLSVETSGSIYDSPAAEPERPKSGFTMISQIHQSRKFFHKSRITVLIYIRVR